MYATDRSRERGSAFVAVTILLVTMAGLSLLLIASPRAANEEVAVRIDATKAFYVAEGGLDLAVSQLAVDQYWPIRATTRFPTVNGSTELESDWMELGDNGGEYKLFATYEEGDGTPLDVSDRTSEPLYEQVELRVIGRNGPSQRTIRARLQFTVTAYDSAIVSDSPEIGTASGSGKSLAKDHGTVSFDSPQQYVYGGIRANAGVYVDGVSNPLTDDNKDSLLEVFTGDVETNLYGTAEEIPDYTDPGSPEQLFEFERFKAAAAAGAGAVINGLDALRVAANAANAAGTAMEGIIYVEVDAAVEGNGPKIEFADIPGGINVRGTLVFDFSNTGDAFYKVFIKCPLSINAGTLPDPFDPLNPDHLVTGYPPVISPDKDPRGFEIGSSVYADFPENADMPALMFNTGTVDIHDYANICGVVYGPSFIEIENKSSKIQYFNGIVIGGGGVYVEGASGAGAAQVFVFDPSTVNALPTYRNRAKVPKRNGFLIDD